jgi:hypothetical protein
VKCLNAQIHMATLFASRRKPKRVGRDTAPPTEDEEEGMTCYAPAIPTVLIVVTSGHHNAKLAV